MSLLTEQEITEIVREAARGSATRRDGSTSLRIARAIEAKVIEKIKAQGPTAYWDGCYSDPYFKADYNAPGIGKGGIPIYRLPEGD